MEKIRTILGNVLGTASIGVGLWVALADHVSAASACLSAGVLILLIANINHFEFIKGFGFEAKTKQLDEKIEEADRLLTQLKLASQLFADISVQLMARIGRWAGPIPKRETQDLVARIQALLKSLEIENPDIDKSLDPFHRMMLRDLALSGFNAFFIEMNRRSEAVNEALKKRADEERARTGAPIAADDAEHLKLQAEWRVIREFSDEARKQLENSDSYALGSLLERLVATAPGWSDAERHTFIASIKSVLDEWNFYAINKRLSNVATWLSREYGQ